MSVLEGMWVVMTTEKASRVLKFRKGETIKMGKLSFVPDAACGKPWVNLP